MRNHDQKTRDMARSILPSTGRHLARKRKKIAAGRARAQERALLDRLVRRVDDLDGVEDRLDAYDVYPTDRAWLVNARRDADKVAPLIRWTEARVERTPRLAQGDFAARRSYFASLLGDTVVGRHALSHIEHLLGEENPWQNGSYPGEPTWDERRKRRYAEARDAHLGRARLLDDVLAGADSRRLNARIVALTPPVEEHWALDADGRRVATGLGGFEPWCFDGDRDRWLAVRHGDRWRRFGIGNDGPEGAQAIAFEALAQVHAEMFGSEEGTA